MEIIINTKGLKNGDLIFLVYAYTIGPIGGFNFEKLSIAVNIPYDFFFFHLNCLKPQNVTKIYEISLILYLFVKMLQKSMKF